MQLRTDPWQDATVLRSNDVENEDDGFDDDDENDDLVDDDEEEEDDDDIDAETEEDELDDDEVVIRVELGEGRPEVRVVDHGPGIDPVVAERIFEPLEQAEDLHTRTHQGVGLGLSLARMSARAMEGDVQLEATGPTGSTFVWIVSVGPGAPE